MELNKKVAIITGSAQGLGKAFAARLLKEGAKVCISDVNKDKGEAALCELQEKFGAENVHFVSCDVTSDEQFRNLFNKTEEYFKAGCVDILVNNAGINTNYGWRKCMNVNIMAVMNGTEIALERMTKSGKPCQIINTASMAAFGPGVNPTMSPYTVSKHGVVQLTRTMAKSNDDIMYKAICPAWADTEIVHSAVNSLKADYDKVGGLMTPEYVAEGFYQLLTGCSNGAVMCVIKDFPYIVMPDYNLPMLYLFAGVAKLVGRVLSSRVVLPHHLITGLATLFLIFCYMLTVIF